MENEDQGKPGRGFFMFMGAIMIVVGVLVVAALVVPIQPGPPKVTPKSGIIMPSGAGNDQLNFSPAKVVVVVGVNNTVVWTNEDNVAHTVKSETVPAGADPFSSDILNNGQTFSVTLTVPGTYTYECTIHPLWMQATIIVVGATNSSSPSSGSGV